MNPMPVGYNHGSRLIQRVSGDRRGVPHHPRPSFHEAASLDRQYPRTVMIRTVLVVEDTDVCRDALEVAFMKLHNLSVRCVATAEEALAYLDAAEVSALVTDLHLPNMDGFELIQKIRSQPDRALLPILMISGDSDPLTPARAIDLGADAYFPKPYSPIEVRDKLEQLINAS
jgi:DNA-binding response OmpR family regulator